MVALRAPQLKALVAVLHEAVLDTSHQTAAFGLLKCLVHQKVVVSEVYDLMDVLAARVVVTASRLTIRSTAAAVFVRFLLCEFIVTIFYELKHQPKTSKQTSKQTNKQTNFRKQYPLRACAHHSHKNEPRSKTKRR